MIALIDGDVLVYRVGFSSEQQTEAQNCMNMELVVEDILAKTESTGFEVFLSDSLKNNYRFALDPNYKANRKDAPKPKFYDSLRAFLKSKFLATITSGEEADDRLGITQTQEGRGGTVICSIDKDLWQIPGLHYNLATGEKFWISPVEGMQHFYKQLLIGDRVDNIQGVAGIGKVKAGKLIDRRTEEADMFEVVRTLYDDDERLLRNGRLLWIRRRPDELWEFPVDVPNESGVESCPVHEGSDGEEDDLGSVSIGAGLDPDNMAT